MNEQHDISECQFCSLASEIDELAWWIDESAETIYGPDEVATDQMVEAVDNIMKLPVCHVYLRKNRLTCTLCGGSRGVFIGYPGIHTYKAERRDCDCFLWNEYRDGDGNIVSVEE